MEWDNDNELKELIEEQYKIETGIINDKGENETIYPEINITSDEIVLIYELQQKMATFTDIGIETLNQIQKVAEGYLLSANKVYFEITEIFNDKSVVLTIDRDSFEDAIRGL